MELESVLQPDDSHASGHTFATASAVAFFCLAQRPIALANGPLISWSFPNRAQIRTRITGARADTDAALAQFDGSVMSALGETETVLAHDGRTLENSAVLKAARDQGDHAVRTVRGRQREGQVDSLSLLDAERTFADTEAPLADADGRIANAQIDLFKALGGGWEAAAVAPSSPPFHPT